MSKPALREVTSTDQGPDPVNPAWMFSFGKKNVNVTRIEGFGELDITFPVPYKLIARETYALRSVKGKWQVWEISPVPNQPGAHIWVREAPRVR